MKINGKKIPAFTLTEMLVVLTISTIVATLAFSILSLVNKNLTLIQQNYLQTTELSLLRQQLVLDFNQYHEITLSSNSETLNGQTPLDTVSYSFSEDKILRNGDTIYQGKYTRYFFYSGKPVTIGFTDAIKLNFGESRSESMFVYKKNDAFQKLKSHGN